MKIEEWDKVFFWLMALFPKWEVTKVTSSIWYEELGKHITSDEFLEGVRCVMDKKPSPFPPGVFEIKAVLTEKNNPAISAEEAWDIVLHGEVTDNDPHAVKMAARTVAGRDLEYIDFDELKWIKKDFINYYNSISESKPALTRIGTSDLKQIGIDVSGLLKSI